MGQLISIILSLLLEQQGQQQLLVSQKISAAAAIAQVGTATVGDSAGSDGTIPSAAKATTTGNLLVILITSGTNSITVTGVADTAGNTYTQCTSAYVTGAGIIDIWYAKNITGNAANVVTATFSSNGLFRSIHQVEYSGASTSAPFETATTGAATGTAVTSGSFSTAGSGNVNVAIGTQAVSGVNTWSAGTNYTLLVNSGSAANSESEHRLAAPSGSQTASISFTPSTTLQISVASFKQ